MQSIMNINIEACVPGMKVSEEILNSFGATLIQKDSVLDNYTINKLMELGIESLKVYEGLEPEPRNSNKVAAIYSEWQNFGYIKGSSDRQRY